VSGATSAGRLDYRKVPNPGATVLLIFRGVFDMASGSEIFWTALSERRGGLKLGGAAKPGTHLAMNLLLLLAVAVPLSCLAFLSWLALLGVMTLGAVINVIGIARGGGPQWPRVEPANSSAG
jgi:hypothetical protein